MAQTALITGAARRIGADITRRLHVRGLDVIIHCRHSQDQAQALAEELEARRPGSTRVLDADLEEPSAVRDLAARVRETTDELVLLVNNASSFYPTPVEDATDADWDALMHSNLRAPWILAGALVAELRRNQGAIVNLVDVYSEHPLARHGLYCAAKAGLNMMTRALARDLAPEVRVNGVSPGPILWPEQGQGNQQEILDAVPMGRQGTPGDIADAVAWLGLDTPFVTGQILAVDGGRSLVLQASH